MNKKTLIIIIILVLGIASFFVFKIGGKKETTGETNTITEAKSGLGNDFVNAMLGVQNVNLDSNILKSAAFINLKPSGAVVNLNPEKGKNDPFSEANDSINSIVDGENVSTRNLNFGEQEKTNANITVSKITTTTAFITINNIPNSEIISLVLTDENSNKINIDNIVYNNAKSAFTAVASDLTPNTKYKISISSPVNYNSLIVNFSTK